MVSVRSGFQEWSRKDSGAVAIPSVTKSGSKWTRALSGSTSAPATLSRSRDSGSRKSIPVLAEDVQRREMDGLELVLGDDLRRTQTHRGLPPGPLFRQVMGGAVGPAPPAAAAPGRGRLAAGRLAPRDLELASLAHQPPLACSIRASASKSPP